MRLRTDWRSVESRSSPSRARPPPMMTRAGFMRFSRLATAMPRWSAASATTWSASGSPASAASSMAAIVISRPASMLPGCSARSAAARASSAREPTRVARHPRSPQMHGLSLRVDGQVADLAGDPVRAPVDLAADDVARADAGGHLHVGEVVDAAPRTPPVLAERGQVGVVVDHDRHAEPLAQRLRPRSRPRQAGITTSETRSGFRGIDGARDGDADADEPVGARASTSPRQASESSSHEGAVPLRVGRAPGGGDAPRPPPVLSGR